MAAQFHLSLGVRDLEESVAFFEGILGAKVLHRDPSGYINIDAFGHQITLKSCPGITPDLDDFHFGFNMSREQFEVIAEKVMQMGRDFVTMEPKIVDGGTHLERKKMYLASPTGYSIELKGVNALS